MIRTIVLDAGPLWMLAHRGGVAAVDACKQWLEERLGAGDRAVVPEVADYEVRRELLRSRSAASIERLDRLVELAEYVPLTTSAMRLAARIWADARQRGRPTADRKALDVDAILAAQAIMLEDEGYVIATTNVAHLDRFAHAALWNEIR